MLFRTELALSAFPEQLSLRSRIFSVGSCFAEVMGNRLKENKFSVIINPFGTIFNPVSLTRLLETSLTSQKVTNELMVEREGIWYHYDVHSSIWGNSQAELNNFISRQMEQTATYLHQTDWLFLTLGTAFVYRLNSSGQIVANCHKMPSQGFDKQLVNVAEVTQAISDLYARLLELRPQLQILLTVSPVRHIKDGIPENQVSKSILRVACHELTQRFSQIHYFPSYELMIDDLRDYRFYKKDMIHPSEAAEEYIWDKFAEVLVDTPSKAFIKEWHSIRQAITHKPFHPDSAAHQQFLKKTLGRLKALSNQVDVTEEINTVASRIK